MAEKTRARKSGFEIMMSKFEIANFDHYKEKLYLNHFKRIKRTISMLLILKLGLVAMATRLKNNIKIKWIGPMTILLRDQNIISLYIIFMGV